MVLFDIDQICKVLRAGEEPGQSEKMLFDMAVAHKIIVCGAIREKASALREAGEIDRAENCERELRGQLEDLRRLAEVNRQHMHAHRQRVF